MLKTFALGFAACLLALGMAGSANANQMIEPPADSGFYECNEMNNGLVMRYAVGIPPYQTVYVYQCLGGMWSLIDIEYY